MNLVGRRCFGGGFEWEVLRTLVTDYRADLRRPRSDRLTELDDLLQSNLITPDEHESIKQALLTKIETGKKSKTEPLPGRPT